MLSLLTQLALNKVGIRLSLPAPIFLFFHRHLQKLTGSLPQDSTALNLCPFHEPFPFSRAAYMKDLRPNHLCFP
uniref:Uncharacterized protein MANES_09G055600 n=1 Tax=Rhizophora mucronata TaxID=61149 RepID=A0A2P2KH71_RHIMU